MSNSVQVRISSRKEGILLDSPEYGQKWRRRVTKMYADAWGCPVMAPPNSYQSASFPQVQPAYHLPSPNTYLKPSSDTHPGEEVIDKVVKEAISKPWLPLPIGLKSPSTDIVLAELSKQGISSVPPHRINGHHHR